MTKVEVAWGPLRTAWRRMSGEELQFQFRPDGEADACPAVEAALHATNAWAERVGRAGDTYAEGVSASDGGPVAFMNPATYEDLVREWIERFAVALEREGWSGAVVPARQKWPPRWLWDEPAQLTAFASYTTTDTTTLEDVERGSGWHVRQELTERISASATAWASVPGGRTYLKRNVSSLVSTTRGLAAPLADALNKHGLAAITTATSARSAPRTMRKVEFTPQGQACFMLMDDATDWQGRLAVLKDAIVDAAGYTELAFIRLAHPLTAAWFQIGEGLPLPYGSHPSRVAERKELHRSYVPDAHGIQLLTTEHLARAHDLSRWLVNEVAEEAYLVEAVDLAPWYSGSEPDNATVERARQDFGMMIATPAVLEPTL